MAGPVEGASKTKVLEAKGNLNSGIDTPAASVFPKSMAGSVPGTLKSKSPEEKENVVRVEEDLEPNDFSEPVSLDVEECWAVGEVALAKSVAAR
jgi:hypothetical protein